jgi:hypothetical protein
VNSLAALIIILISLIVIFAGNQILSPTTQPSITPTPTLLPSIPVVVKQPSYCHNGPNENYPSPIIIPAGSKVGILAKNSDGEDWFLIQAPTLSRCWINSRFINSSGIDTKKILNIPTVSTVSDNGCYTYPDFKAELQTVIPEGWKIVIIGKSDVQADWLLVTPHDSTEPCWIKFNNLSITIADFQDIPVNSVSTAPTLTPTPLVSLEINWKILSYDCSNGQVTGVRVDLNVSGGVPPYTYLPELPLYAKPNQVVSINVKSNTSDGEPSGIIKLTIPSTSDFKCGESGSNPGSTPLPSTTPLPPTVMPPTPTLCWPPGKCK